LIFINLKNYLSRYLLLLDQIRSYKSAVTYASLVPNIHLPTPQLKKLAHHVSGETIKFVAAYLFAYEAGVIIGLKILIFKHNN
jgi:hypothetical protein